MSNAVTNTVSNANPPRLRENVTPGTGTGTGRTSFHRGVEKETKGLNAFNSAPSSVQAAFWRQLTEELANQREWISHFDDSTPDDEIGLAAKAKCEAMRPERPTWDESWERRARAIRRAQAQPETDFTPDRDADPLVEIPTRVYVEALTGEEVPANGQMRCPLPDHDDRNPSFKAYSGHGWRCFGCGKSGSIYDLAAALWDVPTRGVHFRELHKRLREVFV